MAKKKQGNVAGAVVHGAIGAMPFGNVYEGYKGAKKATGSTGVGVAGGIAATMAYPFGGVAGGAYHGYHTAPKRPRPGVHPGATHSNFHKAAKQHTM